MRVERLGNEYPALCLHATKDEIQKLAGPTAYLEVGCEKLREFRIALLHSGDLERFQTRRRIVARVEELTAEVREARALLEEACRDAERTMDAALAETLQILDKTFPDSLGIGRLVSKDVSE